MAGSQKSQNPSKVDSGQKKQAGSQDDPQSADRPAQVKNPQQAAQTQKNAGSGRGNVRQEHTESGHGRDEAHR
jgi:hypothetical protein